MRIIDWRGHVLAGAALGDGVTLAEVESDSTVVTGTPVTPAPVSQAADATSPNGDGHSEVDGDSGTVTISLTDSTAVVSYTGNGDSALTTGYIQSATAGRGVISITTNQAFTYTGTGSTLVSGTSATNADTLFINARSVTMTTGTLTALGAGSRALDVTATGGAGSGGINVTVNGDILSSAGRAIVLDQNDDAATGNVVLTSTAGNTITSGGGNAVTILAEGSGTITVDLNDLVSATGGDGIVVRDSVRGGDISITTAAVSALSVGEDAINVRSVSETADVAVTTNGTINGGNGGVEARILGSAATGIITVTVTNAINAGNDGIEAVNSGTGSTTVNALGSITAAAGKGILAQSAGGAITVTTGHVTSTALHGIDVFQTDANGDGAVSLTANGDISGTDGIRARNNGTGALTIVIGGSVTGTAGEAIGALSNNSAAGAISVTTTAGQVVSASTGDGIDVETAGSGDVSVFNAAAITSAGAGVSTLLDGIDINARGTGNITVNNTGAIGDAGDRSGDDGMDLAIDNVASAGTVSVTGSGAIFSVESGIDVFTGGSGAISVVYAGVVDTTSGSGIEVDTTSGSITVTNGSTINAFLGQGIKTLSTTGDQAITVNGAINAGLDGVHAGSTSGSLAVSVNADVTAGDDAVEVSSNGAKTIIVAAGRMLSGGDSGIDSMGIGATTISNSGTIIGTSTAIFSVLSATTVNNLTGGTIDGTILLSDVNDTVTNAGTIAGTLSLGTGDDLYDGRNGSISGTVNGNAGSDTLRGGAAAETLSGGIGADTLEGNGGSDTLTGGADGDTFRGQAAGLNGDTITDLAAGDRIVITDAGAGFTFSQSGNTLTFTGGSITLTGFSGQLVASAAAGGGVQLTVVGAPINDVRDDFNGDGRSDILWRHDSGLLTDWLGTASGGFTQNFANSAANVPTSWHVAATGDFDGDGNDDILWRHDSGLITDWLGEDDGGFADNFANAAANVATSWQVVGTGDFDGDGNDDILWRHDSGLVTDWLGEDDGGFAANFANSAANVPTSWHVAATGDFDGDGNDDILWRHDSGLITDWLGEDDGGFADNFANAAANVATSWHIVGTGDFNGDGRDDILWRHDSGLITNWLGEADGGFAANGSVLAQAGAGWSVAATGNYNGDSYDDILWRNENGQVTNWLGGANGGFTSNHANFFASVQTSWSVQPEGLV